MLDNHYISYATYITFVGKVLNTTSSATDATFAWNDWHTTQLSVVQYFSVDFNFTSSSRESSGFMDATDFVIILNARETVKTTWMMRVDSVKQLRCLLVLWVLVTREIYAFKLRNTWFERIYVSFAEPLNLVQLHSHWARMAGQVFMHNFKLTERNNMDWPGWERSNLGAYWILIKPPPLRPSAPFQRWTCKPTWN